MRNLLVLILLAAPLLAQEQPLTEEREKPTYGGEIDEGSTPLRTTGRVIFFPLFLVTEYGIRWPLTFIARPIEKHKVIEKSLDFVTWNDKRIGIRPTMKIETDRAPGVGAMLFWKEFLVSDSEYDMGFNTDFNRNLTIDVLHRTDFDSGQRSFTLGGRVEDRDDFNFYGIGADTEEDDEAEFFRSKRMGYLRGSLDKNGNDLGGWFQLEVAKQEFACGRDQDDDICGLDHTANTTDDLLLISGIDGFTPGFQLTRLKLNLFWDTREDRPRPGTGIRAELFGRFGQGFGEESKDVQFFRYGAETGFFLDLFSVPHRVIGLRLNTEFAEATSGNRIPFSELITMGGTDSMRGFAHARFHGFSSVYATLDYRYPVWSFLDGYIFVDVGNVFAARLDDFATEKLRGSTGLGFRGNASRTTRLNIQFAFGSTRFDASEFGFESHRFVFGSSWGF